MNDYIYHSEKNTNCSTFFDILFSPNSFSYRGSYFKLQILWIRCGGGGCHTGCRWRCNLLMCVGVRGLQI